MSLSIATLAIAKNQAKELIAEASLGGGSSSTEYIDKAVEKSTTEIREDVAQNSSKLSQIEVKINTIDPGANVNTIEGITINGKEVSADESKNINLTVPEKMSELTNDLGITASNISSISINNVGISPDENKNINLDIPSKLSELVNDTEFEANAIRNIKLNGTLIETDDTKSVNILLPTKLSELANDIGIEPPNINNIIVNNEKVAADEDKNVSLVIPEKLSELTNDSHYEPNRIDVISVNNLTLPPNAQKIVNISIPVKLSDLSNDKDYITIEQVNEIVSNYVSGIYRFKGVKDSFIQLPTENVLTGDAYIIRNADPDNNINAGDNTIAIVDEANNISWNILSGTIDLSAYVQKEEGKILSSNDFTSDYKTKLDNVQIYIHPSYPSCVLGIYKISVDNTGHLNQFVPIKKEDIMSLGIQSEIDVIPKSEIDAMFADW